MKLWSLKGIEILVVDDFPSMRSMMISMLKAYGADKIHQARNGKEAIQLIQDKTPQIVLCDYNLGEGKDGQEVLEEAKERELLPYSSIFFLVTAENTNLMVMGTMEYRPDDYLVKPFTKDILQSRIRKIQSKKIGLNAISSAINEKKFPKALELIAAELSKNGSNKLELMRIKGEILIKNMDYAGAQSVYDEVLDIREISWAQFGLGISYYYQKDLSSALDIFEELIQMNSNFLLAYDWLAKVENELGNLDAEQEILQRAVKISPKGVSRQQKLADVALANKDFVVAESAFTHVVKFGQNSYYKNPNDFGGLAKVYAAQQKNDAASAILDDMSKVYKHAAAETQLQVAVLEGVVRNTLGDKEKCKAAIDTAMELFVQNPDRLKSEEAFQLAEACFEMGNNDQATELMKHVVRNKIDSAEIMDSANKLFKKYNVEDVGEKLIANTSKEIVDINNKGVALVKDGKLRESLRLFQQAARAMSENSTVNLNAAQSLIMMMKTKGVNENHLAQTRQYLDRVRIVDGKNSRYTDLLAVYKKLAN